MQTNYKDPVSSVSGRGDGSGIGTGSDSAGRKELFPELRGCRALKERLLPMLSESGGPSVSHAYTVEGGSEAERLGFAVGFAQALSCENRETSGLPLPCGKCRSCRNIAAGISPDVTVSGPEEGRATLGVDAVRALRADIRITPSESDFKVYILRSADSMTVQAQNAFLLTLEEPPPYAVILLLCRDSRALLETVRSRAPALRLDVPADGGGEDIAAEARETADRFVELAADRTGGAEAMTVLIRGCSSRDAAAAVMAEISLALRDLVAFRKCGPQKAAPLFYTDRERAADLSEKFTVSRLMGLSDLADEAKTSLARNMNTRLTLMKFLGDAKML